jgi:flagellar hook-associated protein 2
MASGITFSGFNKIDFNMILNAVMAQERAPLTALETQKTTLASQNTAFSTLATKLGKLEAAAEDLADASSFSVLTGKSGDSDAVGISTVTGSLAGTYDLVVTRLATAQVSASGNTYASVDAPLATGGTLSLQRGTDDPVDINYTGTMTLKDLAEAVNAEDDSPVVATVVQTAPGAYRLVLTGKNTGTANAVTVSVGKTQPADPDPTLTFGATSVDALDASFKVNGIQIASSSNTVTDVVPGATLTLKEADAAKTVRIDVSRSGDDGKNLLKAFVTAYNEVLTFLGDQNTAAVNGKASIGRDALVRGLRNDLRSAIQARYAGGEYEQLGAVGIGFDVSGKMKLDDKVFDQAVAGNAADLQTLFAGADGTSGAFGALKALIKGYTEAGGFLGDARDRIKDQTSRISARLDTMEVQLEVRRAALQRDYIAADMLMTQLSSQGSSLGQLGGQYRLF